MRLQFIFILAMSFAVSGCKFLNFADEANSKFADQHFKTAISLIETYKIRYGYYPENLDSLTHLGDWDKIAIASVEYERQDSGYNLDVVSAIVKGKPSNLNYPPDFWQGLGLKKSNLLNNNPQ